MFWRKRNRKRNQSANAAMNWIIIATVGLAFINHMGAKDVSITDAIPDAAINMADKTIVDLKEYKNTILPAEPTVLTIQDVKLGEGAHALCGQTVKLAYEAATTDGEPIEDSASKSAPFVFTLGNKKALPAFEEGIEGMQIGGIRKLTAPASMAYGAEGFGREKIPLNHTIVFTAELLDITPRLPAPDTTSFRYVDVQQGAGPEVTCGSATKVHLTVWGTDGSKLFTTHGEDTPPLTITPGSSTHFLGLEDSVIGMMPGGFRTVIVPPLFQKTLHGARETLEIPFPKGQTVLVDIESVQ